MHTAKAVASAVTEMHAAKAVASASAMTSAEMTSAAVAAATVTTAASRQRRTRQQARDNQNGNSHPGLRHVIAPASLSARPHYQLKRRLEEPKVPREEVVRSHSLPFN